MKLIVLNKQIYLITEMRRAYINNNVKTEHFIYYQLIKLFCIKNCAIMEFFKTLQQIIRKFLKSTSLYFQ